MNEILYCIKDKRGDVIAKDLNLDNAMIFVKALFETYYCEENIAYIIKRQKENGEVKE